MSFLPTKIDALVVKKISVDGRGNSLLRSFYVLIGSFFDEQISLRAASLVYTTLLAFVPLLAVSVSVLKAFGVNTQLEITLYYFLEPLGEKGVDISYAVIQFVEHMNFAVLGAVGLSTLMYTVISAIGKMESALNSLWQVRGARHLSEKFSSYLSIVMVGPVLGFTAFSLMVSVKTTFVERGLLSIPGIGWLALGAASLFPYVLVWTAFTLLYLFLPNTRVRLRSALTGGGFAAVSWGFMGWAFTSFIASSSRYSAVYSGLAALFLFVIWLYWNWLSLLAGAKVAFCHQHSGCFAHRAVQQGSSRMRERTALRLLALMARSFYSGTKPPDAASVAEELGVSAQASHQVILALIKSGVIAATAADPAEYLFIRDPETISLKDAIEAVRREDEVTPYVPAQYASEPEIEAVITKMDDAASAALEILTVKGLVRVAQEEESKGPGL